MLSILPIENRLPYFLALEMGSRHFEMIVGRFTGHWSISHNETSMVLAEESFN
jgi:hypothetical protein